MKTVISEQGVVTEKNPEVGLQVNGTLWVKGKILLNDQELTLPSSTSKQEKEKEKFVTPEEVKQQMEELVKLFTKQLTSMEARFEKTLANLGTKIEKQQEQIKKLSEKKGSEKSESPKANPSS